MIARLIINLGLFALGYYVGREVGRTESVRERMRQVRETGGPVNLREGVVIDMEPVATDQAQHNVKD
ncbi:MAG: hypothetical protein PVG22_08675 [Chromatiales bacterium]|jgi:hypothetical protein